MWKELQSDPSYGLQQLEGSTNPYQAAQIFGSDYERYGVAGARNQDAVNIYNQATTGGGFAQTPASAQSALQGAFSGQLGGISAAAGQQYAGLAAGGAANVGQEQLTLQQLQQQYQNAMAGFGIQGKGLRQQGAFETAEYGVEKGMLGQERKYAGQEYGYEQQQQALEKQGISQALANIKSQYGYQTGEMALARQQQKEGEAGAGVYTSGTEKQAGQQYGLARGSAAEQYQYNVQQQQQAMKEVGLQGQQERAAYQNQLAQLGFQGQQQGLQYGYEQQQLQNALAQLGLQETAAGQAYGTGQQQAANTLLQQQAQQLMQQGQLMGGISSQVSNLYNQLFQAGGYTGGY
jgi:hypothetical protein